MRWISMIVSGAVVGVLARFFMPGEVNMGMLMTIVLGIAGSFVGGFIGDAIKPGPRSGQLAPAGWLGSIGGGMLLIFLARLFNIGL